MFKKCVWIILLCSPICAWGSNWGMGPYVGAGIGVDAGQFRQNSHTTRFVTGNGSFNVFNNTQLSAEGILGNIFAGYSWNNACLYLAGEINSSFSSAKFHSSNNEILSRTFSHTTYKINHNWGLSALPGIMLPSTTLFFGRIGYVNGLFTTNTTDNSLANISKHLNGIRYGLGLQKNICNNFDARLEYSRISYQDHTDLVFEPIGQVTKKTTVSPSSNQFFLELIYRFC